MYCPKCGKEIPDGSKFCTSCGSAVNTENTVHQDTNVPPPIYNNTPINNLSPAQEILNKSSKFKKKYVGIAVAVVAVIIVIVLLASGGKTEDIVRDGTFNGYPEMTVGEAFAGFFDEPTWTSYTESGTKYVKFTGGCTLYNEPVKAKIIFEIDGKNFNVDSFKIGTVNIVSASDLENILDKIYSK